MTYRLADGDSGSLYLYEADAARLVWPTTGAFDPLADLDWTAVFWASDPAWTPPADGGAVSSWRDGSGNDRHATQGDGTRQPLFRASDSVLNSRPCVDFDGSNDWLDSPTFTDLTSFSVFMVVKFDAGGDCLWLGYRSGTSGSAVRRTSGGFRVRDSTATTAAFTQTTTDPFLFWGHINNQSPFTVKSAVGDTVESSTLGSVIPSANVLRLGARPNDGASLRSVRIAFAGIIAGDISADPAWTQLSTWARDYYNIVTPDPAVTDGAFFYSSSID